MRSGRHADLALEVTKAAFKAIFPSTSTRYEGLADLAKYAFMGADRWKEQNSLRRQLEDGVDVLTERLALIEAAEFRMMESAEKDIATTAVVNAIANSEYTKRQLEVEFLMSRDAANIQVPGWMAVFVLASGGVAGRVRVLLAG